MFKFMRFSQYDVMLELRDVSSANGTEVVSVVSMCTGCGKVGSYRYQAIWSEDDCLRVFFKLFVVSIQLTITLLASPGCSHVFMCQVLRCAFGRPHRTTAPTIPHTYTHIHTHTHCIETIGHNDTMIDVHSKMTG